MIMLILLLTVAVLSPVAVNAIEAYYYDRRSKRAMRQTINRIFGPKSK